jgi:hypothetical protein
MEIQCNLSFPAKVTFGVCYRYNFNQSCPFKNRRSAGSAVCWKSMAPGASYTGEGEEHRIIEELTSFLVQAAALEAQEITNGSGRRVGRPRDVMTPYLAPELLSVYLRCHNSGGRQSVATSTDGKLGQKEAGLLFEFIKGTIEPLNRYLTTELHRRPLSASRLARFALGERLRVVRVAKRQKIVALEKRRLRLGGLNP